MSVDPKATDLREEPKTLVEAEVEGDGREVEIPEEGIAKVDT